MKKPLSFKDMQKNIIGQTPTVHVSSKPLASPLTDTQWESVKLIIKQFTKFCNTLTCPMCGSNLDGNVQVKHADLFCRAYPEEYECRIKNGDSFPFIRTKRVSFESFQYEEKADLVQFKDGSSEWHCTLSKIDLSMRSDLRYKFKEKLLFYFEDDFNFYKFKSEKEFKDYLKTYLIFK
jgi:hypothetical protein